MPGSRSLQPLLCLCTASLNTQKPHRHKLKCELKGSLCKHFKMTWRRENKDATIIKGAALLDQPVFSISRIRLGLQFPHIERWGHSCGRCKMLTFVGLEICTSLSMERLWRNVWIWWSLVICECRKDGCTLMTIWPLTSWLLPSWRVRQRSVKIWLTKAPMFICSAMRCSLGFGVECCQLEVEEGSGQPGAGFECEMLEDDRAVFEVKNSSAFTLAASFKNQLASACIQLHKSVAEKAIHFWRTGSAWEGILAELNYHCHGEVLN